MRRVLFVLSALVLAGRAGAEQVSSDALLKELADPLAITRFPDPPFRLLQSSSYDRASVSAADHERWFANADAGQFLRIEERNGRQESVMLDTNGPGAVVRIWSPNPKGTLRVYLDGNDAPAIEAPMQALLDGSAIFGAKNANAPFAAELSKGWNLFVPITFAKRCVITTDEGSGVYYQINWRAYDEGTSVAAYEPDAVKRFPGWPEPARELFTRARPMSVELAPGERRALAEVDEGAVIRSIMVSAERSAHAVLIATFDGEETVWIPLAELSRYASDLRGQVPPQAGDEGGFARPVPPTNFYVDWPMPFRASAKLEILNVGPSAQRVSLLPDVQAYAWDARSMHFHATWKRDPSIHTRPFRDYRFVAVDGKGVLAGDSLHVVNPVDAWWGEGDEKIYVDGETFPSHFGTGTEDYYGYGWCCPVPFSHPLHSQSVCEGNAFGTNWGRTIVTRLRGLDSIPFTNRLVFDMELWHWAECDMNYSACTYWYALPGARDDVADDPTTAALGWPASPERPKPFEIPGAVECEAMRVHAMTPGLVLERQGMKAYTPADARSTRRGWSKDEHLWVKARGGDDVLELTIPAEGTRPVRVILHATKSWDYAVVQFSVNGTPAGGPFDLFSGASGRVEPSGPIDLGVHSPERGRLLLRAEVVGKNAASLDSVFYFGLDCVTLEPESGGR
jgi:hypothetical protein